MRKMYLLALLISLVSCQKENNTDPGQSSEKGGTITIWKKGQATTFIYPKPNTTLGYNSQTKEYLAYFQTQKDEPNQSFVVRIGNVPLDQVGVPVSYTHNTTEGAPWVKLSWVYQRIANQQTDYEVDSREYPVLEDFTIEKRENGRIKGKFKSNLRAYFHSGADTWTQEIKIDSARFDLPY